MSCSCASMSASLDVADETPGERWRRRARKTAFHLLAAAAVYGALVLAARLLHRKVLYQPPPVQSSSESAASPPSSPSANQALTVAPSSVPEGAALVTVSASDGTPVVALEFAGDPRRASRTVVHFHGNAETIDDNVTLARTVQKRGASMVLVEYRGYGRSHAAGPSNERGLYADASAILENLAARGIGADRVVLWGQSLGTGVATEMAKRGKGQRLVLVAPFTSTVALARRAMPVLPAEWIMVDRFDNLAKAPDVAARTLVVHGDADDVIPVEFGEELSRTLPHATFYKVSGGHHDNLYKNAGAMAAIMALVSD